jgi:hypothetical protein
MRDLVQRMPGKMPDCKVMGVKLFFSALVTELALQIDAATRTCFCRLTDGGRVLRTGSHNLGLADAGV